MGGDVGDVEVDELSVVVVALAEGDWEAHLPQGNSGAIGDSRERLSGQKLVIGHLEHFKRLDGENVEPCASIDEGLGDEDIAYGWRAEHRERDSGG